jgi:hypothetical protein
MMKPTFETGYEQLCRAFNIKPETAKEMSNNYWLTLEPVDGQAFIRAVNRIIDEGEREKIPAPAVLKRLCRQEKGNRPEFDKETWEVRRHITEQSLDRLYELERQRPLSESEKSRVRAREAILAVEYQDPRYEVRPEPPQKSEAEDPRLTPDQFKRCIKECMDILDGSPIMSGKEEPPF